MRFHHTLFQNFAAPFVALCAVCAPSYAQAFNVDFGTANSAPSSSYGAGSGQKGFWNVKDPTTSKLDLVDTAGVQTKVKLGHTASSASLSFDHADTFGDHEALMDDFLDGNKTIILSGLAPGDYAIYTYAWGPRDNFLTEVRVIGANEPQVVVGGDWTGDHVAGVTYALHTLTVKHGNVNISCSTKKGLASVDGLQIVPLGVDPVTYCTAKSGLFCGTPAMSFTGSPSASASSGFVVSAAPARSMRLGFLLYTNSGRANTPFPDGGHVLCIGSQPLLQGGPVASGGTAGPNCDGVFAIDMNAYAAGFYSPGFPTLPADSFLLNVGEQVNCQFWGRDTATSSFMSDALEYFVHP